jgi:multiple sugar transport system substrate-binding protein
MMAYMWNDAIMALLPNFLEQNPDIKVEPIVVPGWSDYPLKVAAMHASATLGDTLEYNQGPDIYTWAYKGMIRPLDNLIEATGFDIDAFFPAGIVGSSWSGHLYAVPQDTHPGTVCIQFNKTMMEENGVTPPTSDWTWEDMVNIAKEMTIDTDKDGKTDIFGIHNWNNSTQHVYPRLRTNGGQFYDESGHTCLFDQEPNIQTLQEFRDLIWAHKVQAIPQTVEASGVLFRSSKLAMETKTSTHVITMKTATEKDFETDAVVIPHAPDSEKVGTGATGIGYCMTTLTKYPEHVWRFLEWLGGRWFGVESHLQGFIGPGGRRDTWGDPQVIKGFPLAAELVVLLETAEALQSPWNLRQQECHTAYRAILDDLLLDKMTAEEAGQKIVKDVGQILEKPMI